MSKEILFSKKEALRIYVIWSVDTGMALRSDTNTGAEPKKIDWGPRRSGIGKKILGGDNAIGWV